MNGADITRLAPGWQVDDAYAAVWGEIAAHWRSAPEPCPSFRVLGRIEEPSEDEEEALSLVAGYLLDHYRRGLDKDLAPILSAFCLDCETKFAPGTWPGGSFPDDSASAMLGMVYAVCPACAGRLWVPSLQEAERRAEESGRLRAALARLHMDKDALALARDLLEAGHGAEVVALVGSTCVWFGAERLGLGREEELINEAEEVALGPAPVDRVITEPDIHFGTDAYEGQDPGLD